jgi:hypothetical protein
MNSIHGRLPSNVRQPSFSVMSIRHKNIEIYLSMHPTERFMDSVEIQYGRLA